MQKPRNLAQIPAIAYKSAAVVGALLVWFLAAQLTGEYWLFPTPWQVLKRLGEILVGEGFLSFVWYSFSRIALGFLTALAVGAVLAVLAGRFRVVEWMLWPYMITVKSVPVASFIIIALLWFSSHRLSFVISFLMVLPVVYTNLLRGVRQTDRELSEMATVFRMPWYRRLGYLWLPQIKPYLLSACSLSLGLAFKAGIAAEVIGVPEGSIGRLLQDAKLYLMMEDLLAWTVVVVIVSAVFEKLFVLLLKGLFALWERQ